MKEDPISEIDSNLDRRAELEALTVLPDDQIDIADIPEAPAEKWEDARPGHTR